MLYQITFITRSSYGYREHSVTALGLVSLIVMTSNLRYYYDHLDTNSVRVTSY